MATTEKRPVGRPRTRNSKGVPGDYVGFRASRDLKRRLEEAAAVSGRSLSTEAQFRLESSFSEESALGGPDLRRLAYLMIGAFAHSGTVYARSLGRSDDPRSWLADRECFRFGMARVIEGLALQFPGGLSKDDLFYIEQSLTWTLARRERRAQESMP